MAAESIILTANNGTTDSTFNKTSQSDAKSVFSDSANTSSLRRTLTIDHKMAGLGSKASDLHTVFLSREAIDTDTERLNVAKVSLQITVPKGDTITSADILNDIANIMCLFNKNFMNGFALGQTPSGDLNVTGPFNPDID